jgi:polyisoprenoid-binding protein YceI
LAGLGHNHVISTDTVKGFITLDPQLSKTKIQLLLSVSDFIVDDDRTRAKYGRDFSATLTPEQKTGTLNNMLGAKVLDAINFPVITMESITITGELPMLSVDFAATLKGNTKILSTLVKLSVEDGLLHARGHLQLKQTVFGIQPFNILGGALAVRDQLTIHFDLVTTYP